MFFSHKCLLCNSRAQATSAAWMLIVIALIATTISTHYLTTVYKSTDQAHRTVNEIKDKFGYGITIVQLFGEDGSDTTLERFTINMKLAPQTRVLMLDHFSFVASSLDFSQGYTYNESINCSNSSSYEATSGYGITRIFTSQEHLPDRIYHGDIVRLCFKSPNSIPHNSYLHIDFLLSSNTLYSFEVKLPRTIAHNSVLLFP